MSLVAYAQLDYLCLDRQICKMLQVFKCICVKMVADLSNEYGRERGYNLFSERMGIFFLFYRAFEYKTTPFYKIDLIRSSK